MVSNELSELNDRENAAEHDNYTSGAWGHEKQEVIGVLVGKLYRRGFATSLCLLAQRYPSFIPVPSSPNSFRQFRPRLY